MKHHPLPALALALLLPASHALAQHMGHGHDSTHTAQAGAPATLTEAEVRKVDKAAGKITLRHGEIRNLDMPPMTMVFQVRDAALLDKVRAGDQVRFTAEQIQGAYVVLTLEPVKQ
jgi:Cu(I)/Ag(I) efflux system protein CusF